MKSNCKWMLIVSVIFIAGCSSNSIKQSGLVYFNDFENIKGWGGDLSRLTDYKAHSGQYATFTDTAHQYSQTFKILFKEISKEKIKGVNYSLWVFAEALPAIGTIVVSTKSGTVDPVTWSGNNIENYITEAGQWVKIKAHVDIESKGSNPENEVGFYLYNTGKTRIFADDFALEFTK